MRSLTCLERKKRNSVDADSYAVSSSVGTRPMARARARNDSPENSPEITPLVMGRAPLLHGSRCEQNALFSGEGKWIPAAAGVRVRRTARTG